MGKLVQIYRKMNDGGPVMQQDHTRTVRVPTNMQVSGYNQWRSSLPKNLQEDNDYDLQGYYNKYGNKGPASNGHLPDEFKKPNHVTFSNESVYSSDKTPGGQWSQENGKWAFKPSPYNIQNVGADSLRNYFKQNEPDSKLDMKANGGTIKKKSMFPSLKKMDDGGRGPLLDDPTQAGFLKSNTNRQPVTNSTLPGTYNSGSSFSSWAGKNQPGISAVGDYGAATVDAFSPTDAYGVRSNGAAAASGALSGASKGAAAGAIIGPEGALIGAGVGAVVGGITGLTGNEKANKLKIQTIQKGTTAQLTQDQQASDARIAGDPSLKYGRMSASYYRFGGVMKNSPAALPRTSKPLPAIQPAQRVMPNITESPNRQMSKMTYGGSSGGMMAPQLPNALRYSATKLFRPDKSLKAQKNQILANGGTLHKQGHIKPHFAPKTQSNAGASSAPQFPSAQPQQQVDPNQVAQMQQMMQQQGGMQQKANGGSIHINPANKGKFNAAKAVTGKSTEELTHSSNPITKKRAIFAQNASHWNKKADGGQVEQLSSQDAMINGPSHENGGVKFPSAGVELEGGETVNNGFVFSKKLGFAKPAATIASQLGKAEKRPESDINTSTVNALQRKTELLKVHQEAAKQAAGIPSDLPKMADGGPVMGKDTIKSPNNGIFTGMVPAGINANIPLSKSNFVAVDKGPGQESVYWGLDPNDPRANIVTSQKNKPFISPMQVTPGAQGSYPQPGNNIPRSKTPAAIHRTSYKFGGSMKKMDDGGTPPNPWAANPITTLINKQKVPGMLSTVDFSVPKLPVLDTPNYDAAGPDLKGTVWTPDSPVQPTTSSNKFNDIAGKVTPFLSNFVNATTKLPLPPIPQVNTEITPNLVDYSASRNEAVRANRSANASARTNLNSGAAVSATTAANLAGQTRAVSQINEAENNQNAQIRNSTAAENAQIRAGNTALQNNYQNELVQRQIKGQNLKSANMANVEEKIQGMARDNKLDNNEHTKLLLTALADPTGASWRGARSTFNKYLSPDEMKTADAHFAKVQAQQDEDRVEAKKTGKLQQAYIQSQTKNAGTDIKSILGVNPPSTIFKKESDKYDRNGNLIQETRTN